MFLLLNRKVNMNSLVRISMKCDMNYSNKLIEKSCVTNLFGLNLFNNNYEHIRHYYCERKTCQKQIQSKHKLLLVEPSNQLSIYRCFWGKNVKKPGEIEPGIKAKDVTLAGRLFKEIPDRHKEHFLSVVDNFSHHKYIKRQGYVEFITAALPFMKEFGVHRDLEAYKALMNIFPRGRYRPENIFQVGFFHFPLQQKTAVEILCAMEMNGVMPDKEMESLIIEIFSKYSSPWRKCARMTYWMTKFANANPFPLPDELPLDSLELAALAIKRMCIDLQTKISVFSTAQVVDSIDKTWIVSAQSPSQQEIISELPEGQSVYVEGPFKVWLRTMSIGYFMLRAENPNKVSDDSEDNDEVNDVSDIPLNTFGKTDRAKGISSTKGLHLQDDGKILAVCATGTSSRDSLLSWIRILQSSNPALKTLPVVFTLRGTPTGLQNLNEKDSSTSFSQEINVDNKEVSSSSSSSSSK